MKSWRSGSLAFTAISTSLATIYALLVPNAGNSAVADFKFPQSIQLKLGKAIILGQLGQIYFKSLFYGNFAIILWGFIGLGMSGRNYYLSKINSLNNS